MKQLTARSGRMKMVAGASTYPHRSEQRRRLLPLFRPIGAAVPLDLEEWEIVADLDPGMIDWNWAGGAR
jgi:hypothetical protein